MRQSTPLQYIFTFTTISPITYHLWMAAKPKQSTAPFPFNANSFLQIFLFREKRTEKGNQLRAAILVNEAVAS